MRQVGERTAVVVMAVALTLTCHALSSAGQEQGLSRVGRRAEAEQLRREQALVLASGLEQWPQSQSLKLAPRVDKALLSLPDLVTRENESYDVVVLDSIDCGVAWVSWRHLVASDAPIPAELPRDLREELDKATAGLSPDARERKLDSVRERYLRSMVYEEKGGIDVKMVVAPSSRAAQEYLIFESTQCSLPIEARAVEFDESNRLSGLGNMAFRYGGTVRFARDNVGFVIHGSGDLASEVEALARKLDAALLGQPSLTSTEWLAARPRVTVGALRRGSAAAPTQPSLPFYATTSHGASIVAVHATINDDFAPVENQEVLLGSPRGPMAAKITVFSDGLLVGSVRQIVQVSGE